jgi:recombination protein RecA
LKENPQIAGEIEAAIRQNAGLVQEQMLDNIVADEDDN